MKHIKRDSSSQVCVRPPGWIKGWRRDQNSAFSEYGHVAYQIKGNDACSNMVASILPVDTPSTGDWVKMSKLFFL